MHEIEGPPPPGGTWEKSRDQPGPPPPSIALFAESVRSPLMDPAFFHSGMVRFSAVRRYNSIVRPRERISEVQRCPHEIEGSPPSGLNIGNLRPDERFKKSENRGSRTHLRLQSPFFCALAHTRVTTPSARLFFRAAARGVVALAPVCRPGTGRRAPPRDLP